MSPILYKINIMLFSFIPNSTAAAVYAMIAAGLMPYLFAIIAKVAGGFRPEDNASPRQFLSDTSGLAARANAAQQNSFESLPLFFAAVIMAMVLFVPQPVVNQLAWVYVALRLAYGMAYLLNQPTLRSIVWALSVLCPLLLFVLSIKWS